MSDVATMDAESGENTVTFFETNLLDKLLISQKKAAHFLELAYYALREDPELARQVRTTADDAQNQHLITHGLVREYEGTALHVLKTMLPLIEVGIRKKKVALVESGLTKVVTYADDMIEKTKTTIEAYYKIKAEVNKKISSIDKKNKEIKDRKSAIAVEMKENNLKIETQDEDYKNLKAENESIEETIKELKSKRQKYIEQSMKEKGSMIGLSTFGMATLATLFRGAEAGKAILEGASAAETARNRQANEQAIEASEKTKQDIDKEQDTVSENEKRLAKMKEVAEQRKVTMEKLAFEGADQMNEESLKSASKELGKVALFFAKVLYFWEDFSSKLTSLSKGHDAVKLFIEFIHDPELDEDVSKSMINVKKVWNSFSTMCTVYVNKSEKQLPKLYAFMSHPIDKMDVTECNKRKQELLESDRAEIKAL